ncbi:unnamed protein product [Ranitomeya imitator]|uniref:Helix-turn-helix domain-containing protein n=1 Tax=Ranitomeya imitator TaxID=111125 RepID=A0ABN9MLB4_9NEOB|nr:unnamed protein product [Ranitomeya imitator]
MGVAFTPLYANLFMGSWEHDFIQSSDSTSSGLVLSYMRFIDDILFIWQGSHSNLVDYLDYLNNNDRNIRLTHTIRQDSIDFLDLKISIDELGNLHTDVFRKTTSTNALLHAKSAHPSHVIRAIPIGQFLRMRRICDQDDVFEKQAQDLTSRFLQRGYQRDNIHRAYSRAKSTNRSSLLTSKKKGNRTNDGQVVGDVEYNQQTLAYPVTGSVIIKNPHQTAVYCGQTWKKTLQDFLVHSHYVPPTLHYFGESRGPKWGSVSCGSCKVCKHIVRTNVFHDSTQKREFKILHYINCWTSMVIYMATCPCNLTYVGMTTRELRVRTLEHVRDIKAAEKINLDDRDTILKLKPLARLFRQFHNNQSHLLRVRGIDRLYPGNRRGDISTKLAQK